MQVGAEKVISFHYSLSDSSGEEIENSYDADPVLYLYGQKGMLVGIQEAMEGKSVGDKINITLPPEKAYGERQEDSIQRVPLKHLVSPNKQKVKPHQLKPGMVVAVNTEQGAREVTVLKIGKFNVDVDLNHPLSGKTLTFDIEVVAVRDASPEEVSHGHPDGVGGTKN